MPRHRSLFGITASLTLGLVVASCSRTDRSGSSPAGLGVTPPPTAGGFAGSGAPQAGGVAGDSGGSRPAPASGAGGVAGSEPAPAGGVGGGAGANPAAAGGVAGGAGTSPAAAGTAGASGTTTANPKDCPTDLPGPKLVRLATPGGVPYCMDRTEVTQKQYATFIEAAKATPSLKDNVKGQHPICKYGFELIVQNAEPTEDTVSDCRGSLYNPEKTGDYPVVCMSHCAARAYCQWAGKELCGAPTGGASDWPSHSSAEKSAWHNACTSGGKHTTAVENGVGAEKCSVLSPNGAGRKSVESESSCHSDTEPFSQILNLGGGVLEWEDSCDASECLVRGAAYLGAGPVEGCDLLGSRGGAAETTGFRCCKPLAPTP